VTDSSKKEFRMFPIIRVRGGAHERGRQYGEQASARVHASIAAYAKVFEHYATWSWETVTEAARDFVGPIEDFGVQYLDELQGIAEGAGVAFEDVLAINLRTEIMFAAKARTARATLPSVAECSSFAVVAADGAVRVGQNWDWLPHAMDTVVVLEQHPEDGPSFVTVVEAGLLAKFGMNSAGMGIATNALVSSEDMGEPGVPYHVMLRALLDCETPREALARLQQHPRASSANYLLAHRSGLVLDVEARPGDFSKLHLIGPDARGVILHTNHFRSAQFDAVDVGLLVMPDSPFRLQRLQRVAGHGHDAVDGDQFEQLLSDHAGYPDSVCCHPNPKDSVMEQGLTVTAFVADLGTGRARLSYGPPCEAGLRDLEWSARPGVQASTASVI
jgi:isopenicillin-N N-acyltransferase-like protein